MRVSAVRLAAALRRQRQRSADWDDYCNELRHGPVSVLVSSIDPITLSYMERVTGKRGQVALDQWLEWVGRIEISVGNNSSKERKRIVQMPVELRIARAYHNARTPVPHGDWEFVRGD